MLTPGKLYDVHGFHIYGTGKTVTKAIETYKQIMYIHDKPISWKDKHVFLADGDIPSGGLINQGLLTRVKIPIGRCTIIGNQIMTNQTLETRYILSNREELGEGMKTFLNKAMTFAQQLPHGEKRDRLERMIGSHLYDDYSISYKNRERRIQKRGDSPTRKTEFRKIMQEPPVLLANS